MTKEEFINHNCKHCGYLCKNRKALGIHLRLKHNSNLQEYILKFYLYDKWPECACGCGKKVEWHKCRNQFNKFINGHNSIVSEAGFGNRPYYLTPEQEKKKASAVKKAYQKNGELIKEKISNGVKNAWKDSKYREKMNNRNNKRRI